MQVMGIVGQKDDDALEVAFFGDDAGDLFAEGRDVDGLKELGGDFGEALDLAIEGVFAFACELSGASFVLLEDEDHAEGDDELGNIPELGAGLADAIHEARSVGTEKPDEGPGGHAAAGDEDTGRIAPVVADDEKAGQAIAGHHQSVIGLDAGGGMVELVDGAGADDGEENLGNVVPEIAVLALPVVEADAAEGDEGDAEGFREELWMISVGEDREDGKRNGDDDHAEPPDPFGHPEGRERHDEGDAGKLEGGAVDGVEDEVDAAVAELSDGDKEMDEDQRPGEDPETHAGAAFMAINAEKNADQR